MEKAFIPFWELLVSIVRKKVGRDTGHRHSELHDLPSWGRRVVGTGIIPQPQQPEGLRNQAPGIAPEKQLGARAPERRKRKSEKYRAEGWPGRATSYQVQVPRSQRWKTAQKLAGR